MNNKLIISWDEYNKTVEELAIKVHNSGFKVDLLIGIMRGGAPIIDVLSRIFKIKCAYMAVESYTGEEIEDQQGDIVFSRELSSTAHSLGGNILLCDDLSDTGLTLNKSIEWLKQYRPIRDNIKEIRIKEAQNAEIIFLSSIFKKNKNYIGIYNFRYLKYMTNKKLVK